MNRLLFNNLYPSVVSSQKWPYIDNKFGDGFDIQSMWQHSALIRVYVNDKDEYRFQPVQPTQKCFRSGVGNVRCVTVDLDFNSDAVADGFGGKSGYAATGKFLLIYVHNISKSKFKS